MLNAYIILRHLFLRIFPLKPCFCDDDKAIFGFLGAVLVRKYLCVIQMWLRVRRKIVSNLLLNKAIKIT